MKKSFFKLGVHQRIISLWYVWIYVCAGGIFPFGMNVEFLCLCYVESFCLWTVQFAARYSLCSSRALRARWAPFASAMVYPEVLTSPFQRSKAGPHEGSVLFCTITGRLLHSADLHFAMPLFLKSALRNFNFRNHKFGNGTKTVLSQQIWGARSSRSVHPNPLGGIQLFRMVLRNLSKVPWSWQAAPQNRLI